MMPCGLAGIFLNWAVNDAIECGELASYIDA